MDGKQLDMVKLEKQNDSSEWIYFDPGRLWDDQHYLYNGYHYQQDNNNYTFFSSSNSSLDYYHYYDHHHHHHNFQFDPFTDFQWEFVDFPVLDHNNFQTKDKDDNNNNSNNKNVHEEEEDGGRDDAGATTKMKMMNNDGGRRRRRDHQLKRSGRRSSKSGGGVELKEIQKYFDVPITKAAKELKIGLTVLKKRCRELNIMRWPHRKIKSLNSLIHNFKELGMCRKEIEMLEHHKRMLEKEPELDLTDRTKRLRQACFKLNYKKRHNSLPSSS